jgi:hypothetical protein
MIAHKAQIIHRDRHLNRQMLNFAALGISPGVRSFKVEQPIREIGSFTYFSLRRSWLTGADGSTPALGLVFAGYKSRIANGRIEIGGAEQNVCAYDLRYRPFYSARAGGKILNSKKWTTLRLGLDLDFACERCALKLDDPAPFLELPQFWAGFRKESLPVIENCRMARKCAVEAIRPEYLGPVLPSLRSPGGTVTVFCPAADGGIGIGFDEAVGVRGESVGPARMALLPRTAVLRPYVKIGVRIEQGAPLADFLPRRTYPNLGMIAELYGADIADLLLQDAVEAMDIEHDGLVLRRAELCSTQLENAERHYEDVRPLLDEHGSVRLQVVNIRNGLVPLCPSGGDGAVMANLAEIRPAWARKFKPLLPRSSNADARRVLDCNFLFSDFHPVLA